MEVFLSSNNKFQNLSLATSFIQFLIMQLTKVKTSNMNVVTFDKSGLQVNSIRVNPSSKDFDSYVNEKKIQNFENELDHLYSCWNEIDSVLNFHRNKYYPKSLLINYQKKTYKNFSHVLWEVKKGMWSLRVIRNNFENLYRFSLSVASGHNANGEIFYSDHPVAIQDFINEKFSPGIYEKWNEEVWNDICSLEEVIEVSKQKIDSVIPSIVPHYRSELLLDLFDIPIQQGVAFLIPSKMGG